MLRIAVLALAALGAAGCTYGSAVDIAPFDTRPTRPIMADGDYCELANATKPYQVKSADGCVRIKWDAALRMYIMTDLEKKSDDAQSSDSKSDSKDAKDDQPSSDGPIPVAVVPLGDGLYAAEVDTESAEAEKRNSKDKHQLSTFIASGDAFVAIPVLQDDDFVRVAKRHTRITFADMPGSAPPPKQGEENPIFARRPWIEKGSIPDIKDFLRDATREAVKLMKPEDWDMFSIGVKDVDQAANHPASAAQSKDADAILRIAKKLK